MSIVNFDFDAWVEMAMNSPSQFEAQREECIKSVISTFRDIPRGHGLQFRIDMEILKARTPMKSCLRISGLMWETFLECNTQLNVYAYGSGPSQEAMLQPKQGAKLLEFRSKEKAQTAISE